MVAHHFGAAANTLTSMAEELADGQDSEHTSSSRPTIRTSAWLAPIALVVALAGTGLAGWGLLRPTAHQAERPSAASDAATEDGARSKVEACSAFDTVRSSVSIQTHAGSDGPAEAQAVAANARLAMLGGGMYLLSRTDPSTPAELADAIHKFANGLQDIGMHSLTGIGNDDPGQADRLRDADAANKLIADICAQA